MPPPVELSSQFFLWRCLWKLLIRRERFRTVDGDVGSSRSSGSDDAVVATDASDDVEAAIRRDGEKRVLLGVLVVVMMGKMYTTSSQLIYLS